eukprot:363811-Chlamydomonas_euryale.AAC.9
MCDAPVCITGVRADAWANAGACAALPGGGAGAGMVQPLHCGRGRPSPDVAAAPATQLGVHTDAGADKRACALQHTEAEKRVRRGFERALSRASSQPNATQCSSSRMRGTIAARFRGPSQHNARNSSQPAARDLRSTTQGIYCSRLQGMVAHWKRICHSTVKGSTHHPAQDRRSTLHGIRRSSIMQAMLCANPAAVPHLSPA